MNCQLAQDQILATDLDELRGRGASPLSRHLQACPDCRGVADYLLDSHNELHDALGKLASPSSTPKMRRALPFGIAALAAAAGLATFLAWPRPSGHSNMTPEPITIDVTAPADRRVAVFTTSNPNIKVVWFFD